MIRKKANETARAPRAGKNPITHIKDLLPDPRNARTHTQKNIGMISDSLRAVGAGRSVVIDEQGVLLSVLLTSMR